MHIKFAEIWVRIFCFKVKFDPPVTHMDTNGDQVLSFTGKKITDKCSQLQPENLLHMAVLNSFGATMM